MARNLLREGHEVTVWNRTPGPAQDLGPEGATVAGSPREAVAGARAVLTVLANWDAVESVMTGPEALSAAWTTVRSGSR
jgi:3-hydroxyisobutyrate dehydrogenase